MIDLSRFTCPNPACTEPGRLTTHALYGRDKRKRMLRCRGCGTIFSERRGTAVFRLKLRPEKLREVLMALAEGGSQRMTAMDAEVNRQTVARFSRMIGNDYVHWRERVKAVAKDCLGQAYNPKDYEPLSLEESLRLEFSEDRQRRIALDVMREMGLPGVR